MAATLSWLSLGEQFPLRDPSEESFDGTFRSLWDWRDCSQCTNRGNCAKSNCSWNQRQYLLSYRQFYHEITFRYCSRDGDDTLPALRKQEDLQDAIRFVRENPDLPRHKLLTGYFTDGNSNLTLTKGNKSKAINLALTALIMMPCSERNPFHVQYPKLAPVAPVTWKKDQAACEVLEVAIPIGQPLTHDKLRLVVRNISAKRLRDCGFEIIDTNDPRLHLESDSKTRRIYVFHQVGFLKEHLSFQARRGPATKSVVLSKHKSHLTNLQAYLPAPVGTGNPLHVTLYPL